MNKIEYMKYLAIQEQVAGNKEKFEQLLKRVQIFEGVNNFEQAKKLAAQFMPTQNPTTIFYVGNAKCTIINKSEMLRISIDSPEQFISYDFS